MPARRWARDAEASAETFAALVTQLLGGQGQRGDRPAGAPRCSPASPSRRPGDGVAEDPAGAVPGETEDEPADESTPESAAGTEATVPLLPQTTAFLAALPLTAAVAPSRDVVVAVTAQATASPRRPRTPPALRRPRRRRPPATPTPSTPARRPPPRRPPAAPTTGHGAPATAASRTAVPTADAATQTPATAPATGEVAVPRPQRRTARDRGSRPAAGAPSDGTLPAASSQPVAATASVAPPTVAAAVAGPIGPAASPVPTASTATSTAGAVTSQVFPEITRLVSAGNGTHRIRLQLEPEALGDVRVVLTIRNGAVDVRLSAGEDAQRALREGAPELRRLLELVGASDTQIVGAGPLLGVRTRERQRHQPDGPVGWRRLRPRHLAATSGAVATGPSTSTQGRVVEAVPGRASTTERFRTVQSTRPRAPAPRVST